MLWWSDIEDARLWMHNPRAGTTLHWKLPERLGSLALCESGRLLLGFAKGLFVADGDWASPEAPRLELLVAVEVDNPRTRINDGRCDRAGNFIFGTLNEDVRRDPIGSFYQYSARGLRRLDLDGVAIPNSLCFSPDGRTLYYCDSTHPRILCCDYDAESGQVAKPRLFVTLPEDGTCPDGSTIDAEGYLWNAQWGGARVVRYSPQGEMDLIVQLPVRNPTCATLGGRGLDHLYITTARFGLSAEEAERDEHSGAIFHWHASVCGLPEARVVHL